MQFDYENDSVGTASDVCAAPATLDSPPPASTRAHVLCPRLRHATSVYEAPPATTAHYPHNYSLCRQQTIIVTSAVLFTIQNSIVNKTIAIQGATPNKVENIDKITCITAIKFIAIDQVQCARTITKIASFLSIQAALRDAATC